MTHAELLREILRGRLIIVGEYRGGKAESAGFVDRRTGDSIKCVYAIYLVECACRGVIDRAIIRQRRIGTENPDGIPFPYEERPECFEAVEALGRFWRADGVVESGWGRVESGWGRGERMGSRLNI